jgi:hypothetical protein
MLSLGDVHAGLGIAIIAYGLASLPQGLSAYDWWILVGLAWVAIITNIATLTSLRDLFRRHPARRDWRLCLIFTMVITVSFCMVPLGRMRQVMASHEQAARHDILSANVLCFFPGRGHVHPSHGFGQPLMGWTYIAGSIVVLAALALTVLILERPGGILRLWCDRYRGEMHDFSSEGEFACARCEQRFVLLIMRPFIAYWLMLRAHLDLLNSVLAEVYL